MRMTLRDVFRKPEDAKDEPRKSYVQTQQLVKATLPETATLGEIMGQMEEDINDSWRWNKATHDKLGKVKREHKALTKAIDDLKDNRNLYDSKLEACRLDSNDMYIAIQ